MKCGVFFHHATCFPRQDIVITILTISYYVTHFLFTLSPTNISIFLFNFFFPIFLGDSHATLYPPKQNINNIKSQQKNKK